MNISDFERGEIEEALAGMGVPRFHGRQIFHWVYARGIDDFAAMTDLGRLLRERLASAWSVATPAVAARQTSSDGTTKFLLTLGDGRQIESVFIPDTPAQTFCVSTQVGCAMACAFCLTGKMGLVRHLTSGEIAGQVRVLARETGLIGRTFNIVLMGMGEPLHNYEQTMKALRMLGDPEGIGLPARRITLSTVGLTRGLERLASEPFMPNLAISLHATTDAARNAIVPLNRRHGLDELIAVCRAFPLPKRRRITFEYVLLAGVNDTPADAARLGSLLGGLRAKVNLLPLNEAPGIPFSRPADPDVDAFARALAERGLTVSVRRSRGRDIRAACGQLLVEGESRQARSPAQSLARRMD